MEAAETRTIGVSRSPAQTVSVSGLLDRTPAFSAHVPWLFLVVTAFYLPFIGRRHKPTGCISFLMSSSDVLLNSCVFFIRRFRIEDWGCAAGRLFRMAWNPGALAGYFGLSGCRMHLACRADSD